MLLSAETFVIEIEKDRYLVYAPLRRAAFIANASGVNAAALRPAAAPFRRVPSAPAIAFAPSCRTHPSCTVRFSV